MGGTSPLSRIRAQVTVEVFDIAGQTWKGHWQVYPRNPVVRIKTLGNGGMSCKKVAPPSPLFLYYIGIGEVFIDVFCICISNQEVIFMKIPVYRNDRLADPTARTVRFFTDWKPAITWKQEACCF